MRKGGLKNTCKETKLTSTFLLKGEECDGNQGTSIQQSNKRIA